MRGDIPVGSDDGEACGVLGEPRAQMALQVLDDLRSRVSRRALARAGARVGDLDEAGAEPGEVVTLEPTTPDLAGLSQTSSDIGAALKCGNRTSCDVVKRIRYAWQCMACRRSGVRIPLAPPIYRTSVR